MISATAQDRARRALNEMIANGAVFQAHRSADGLAPSFTYEVSAGGDRSRCRKILRELKEDHAAFSAFTAAIADMARTS